MQYCLNNPLKFIDPDGHQDTALWEDTETATRVGNLLINAASAVGKSLANAVIGANNFSADHGYGKHIAPYEPKGAMQRIIMHATDVGLLASPLAGKAGPAGVLAADAEETAVVAGEAASIVNKGGRFGDLNKARIQNGETDAVAHHIPQSAAGITSRNDGPAVGMTRADHTRTRTYSARGRNALRQDAGLSPRQRLARDVRDLRANFGSTYRRGSLEAIRYAKTRKEFQKQP